MNARANEVARITRITRIGEGRPKPGNAAGDLDAARGLILAVATSGVMWTIAVAVLVR